MAATTPWRFGQCFGEKDADEDFSEADVLTAVEFDTTGNYLATGDKGGRVVVFERAGAPRVSPASRSCRTLCCQEKMLPMGRARVTPPRARDGPGAAPRVCVCQHAHRVCCCSSTVTRLCYVT